MKSEPQYAGTERREEPDMRVLQNDMEHVKGLLEKIDSRLAIIENSARTACRDCQAWPRIAELEKAQERQKGIVVGVSSLVGVLWAVVGFVVSHWNK